MRTATLILVAVLAAGAEEPPLAPGVTVELRSERTEFAIGDPILLDVVYKNEGDGTWVVIETHVLMFYDPFDVRDAEGAKVPNSFADMERLERGERERVLWLHTCLAVPKTDDLEWKDVFARRREIQERYK